MRGARNAMVAAPYRRFARGSPRDGRFPDRTGRVRASCATLPDGGVGRPGSDRPVDQALNPVQPPPWRAWRTTGVLGSRTCPDPTPPPARPPRPLLPPCPRPDRAPPHPRPDRTPRCTPERTPPPAPRRLPATDTVSDLVRWAAFSCVLVPVVLFWYGTSLVSATGTALGLAAVTGACLVLLRRSERGAAVLREQQRDAERSSARQRTPQQRGLRREDRAGSGGGRGTRERCGDGGGQRGTSGSGTRRGGRHGAGNQPVD